MEKKTMYILGIVLVLVVGALFVQANLGNKEASEESKPTACQVPQPTCNANTCNLECGGTCGIKSCGCS